MQLLVHITNQPATVPPILTRFLEEKITGATVVDCAGMLKTLSAQSHEAPPIFGSLSRFLNPDHEPGKMILVLLKDEDVPTVKEIIHSVAGSLKNENNGIMFTMPVMNWEGVSHKR